MLRLFIGLVACSLCSRRELLLEIMAFATTAQCLQGRTLPVKAHSSEQSLLGGVAAVLAGVEARACHCPTGDSRRFGLKLYWTWRSRHRGCAGRKCVGRELRELIFRMVAENPSWGARRIHGEISFTAEFSLCNTTCSSMTNIQTIRPEL
jgi:hypothetical protein